MKKLILLIVVAIVSATGVNAQTPAKYQIEVDAGYSFGVGQLPQNRVNVHVLNGIRVGDFFSTGIGVGIDYYHVSSGNSDAILPIFLNMKGYLPVSGSVSPYLSFDIGGGVGLTEGVSGLVGMLCTPAIGCAFKTRGKGAFLVSVGYTRQQFSEFGNSLNFNAVSVKLGYQF